MAAEVSSLLRIIGDFEEEKKMAMESGGEKSTLVTRDLLGGSSVLADSGELDLDLQVPNGWEKMLDLKSGKIHVKKCEDLNHRSNQTVPKVEDLNLQSSPFKIKWNLFKDNNSLDLKLLSSSSSSSNYTSVCTLDKVKSALERAEKEPIKKRWKSSSSSSPSYSSSSSSIKEVREDENEDRSTWSPVAASCSNCLSHVLIMKHNPRCPRCDLVVQLPALKKPRIDLNMYV